ncbi:hypothetical protein LOTGIDRAFT_133413, partial [Lottia gigantea]
WTEWFSRDSPSYSGDHENIYDLSQTYPNKVCSNPTEIDARMKGNQNGLVGDMVIYTLSLGFKCINRHQFDGQCNDYEVRFCC